MSHLPNTHILINEFAYHEPATLAEASELLLSAGCANHRRRDRHARAHEDGAWAPPATLVSLRRVPGLAGICGGQRECASAR